MTLTDKIDTFGDMLKEGWMDGRDGQTLEDLDEDRIKELKEKISARLGYTVGAIAGVTVSAAREEAENFMCGYAAAQSKVRDDGHTPHGLLLAYLENQLDSAPSRLGEIAFCIQEMGSTAIDKAKSLFKTEGNGNPDYQQRGVWERFWTATIIKSLAQ